jgi:putative membrane protein
MADFRSWLAVYLKGLCMGSADAVPGVSGGTIALITGIYERLIGAVTGVDADRIMTILGGVRPGHQREAYDAFMEMDGVFLLVLGAGIMSAVIAVTRLLEWAIEGFPVVTFGFFFGLILASAVVLYTEVELDTPGRIAAAVTGFLAAFIVSGPASAALNDSLVFVVLAGAVAVSAMILPGISGSLLLLILGKYEFMVTTLKEFTDGLLGVVLGQASVSSLVADGTVVVAFVSGAFVGLFTIAHAVKWALDRYREATLAFLVSLILGALRAPVSEATRHLGGGETVDYSLWTTELVGVFLVAGVVGAALVLAVDRYTAADIDY